MFGMGFPESESACISLALASPAGKEQALHQQDQSSVVLHDSSTDHVLPLEVA